MRSMVWEKGAKGTNRLSPSYGPGSGAFMGTTSPNPHTTLDLTMAKQHQQYLDLDQLTPEQRLTPCASLGPPARAPSQFHGQDSKHRGHCLLASSPHPRPWSLSACPPPSALHPKSLIFISKAIGSCLDASERGGTWSPVSHSLGLSIALPSLLA